MNIKHVKLVMLVETEPGKLEELKIIDRALLPDEEVSISQTRGYDAQEKDDGTRAFLPNGDFSYSLTIKRTGG